MNKYFFRGALEALLLLFPVPLFLFLSLRFLSQGLALLLTAFFATLLLGFLLQSKKFLEA